MGTERQISVAARMVDDGLRVALSDVGARIEMHKPPLFEEAKDAFALGEAWPEFDIESIEAVVSPGQRDSNHPSLEIRAVDGGTLLGVVNLTERKLYGRELMLKPIVRAAMESLKLSSEKMLSGLQLLAWAARTGGQRVTVNV